MYSQGGHFQGGQRVSKLRKQIAILAWAPLSEMTKWCPWPCEEESKIITEGHEKNQTNPAIGTTGKSQIFGNRNFFPWGQNKVKFQSFCCLKARPSFKRKSIMPTYTVAVNNQFIFETNHRCKNTFCL